MTPELLLASLLMTIVGLVGALALAHVFYCIKRGRWW